MIAYADDDHDDNDHKIKNRSKIKDISDQVVSSGGSVDKEQVQQLLQLMQIQIAQTSGQDKATNAIKQIKSALELNPNGPLAQSILYLSKQQAAGNFNSVNDVNLQVAIHVANGNEDIGQIIKQAAAHIQQVLSSQAPSSSTSSSSSVQITSPKQSLSLSLSQPQSSPSPASQEPGKNPPIANAGHPPAEQIVKGGALVKLDGSASKDPDGDPITFAWTQVSGPSVTLSGSDTDTATFTAPNSQTELVFRLTVTDHPRNGSPSLSSTDEARIKVEATPTPTNNAPIANAGQDQTVDEGSHVRLDGTLSKDPDGDPITFAWTQVSGPSVTLSGSDTDTATFTAPNSQTELVFRLTVTDNPLEDSPSLSSTDDVHITVTHTPTPTGNPPVANAGQDQTVDEGSPVTLDGSASKDPDGGPLRYKWNQTAGTPVTLNPSTGDTAVVTFTAPSGLTEDATLRFQLTVTDNDNLSDMTTQKVTVKRNTNPGNSTEQIYTPKPGGRVFTKMNTSGGNCKSDGIRFNIANEHTLVDRESTWVFTLNNDPKSCTDKPWWSPKIGSHGSTGEGSGLYEASVPYSGGFKSMRSEGPHPQYHSCSGYQHGDVPPMPKGKPIGIKTAQWRIPNGVHVEFWYDFTGGGKGPWVKYASLDDTLPGHCNGGSIKGPIGMNGELIGPAKAQDTMRMNGGSATYIGGSIVELAPNQTPKGSIDSSAASSSLRSPDGNDDTMVSQAIGKESLFNKGLNQGEEDAKEVSSSSVTTSDQRTTVAPSSMTSDDVDCESPDNLSGQDSIDYCKGYDQGFAQQNNVMAEK